MCLFIVYVVNLLSGKTNSRALMAFASELVNLDGEDYPTIVLRFEVPN